MLIAQISDFHIEPPGKPPRLAVDTVANLRACVERINALDPRPDIILATGDLTYSGSDEEYRALRRILEPLPMPLYVLPGNHDEREAMRRAFDDHAYLPRDGEFLHYVVEAHELRLVCLDTLVPGENGGAMCEARLAWFEAALAAAPQRPTLVVMHHPPFRTGIDRMDGMGCAGGEAVGDIVARHSQIERVLCGHVHRPIQLGWRGTVASTAPSTAMQLRLDLAPDAPIVWSEEPPAFLLHLWLSGTGLVSHLSVVAGPAEAAPLP